MPTTLERMMQQAAVDADFRADSVKFGIDTLPEAVEEQDQHFYDLLNDGIDSIGVLVACSSTCSFGPFTIACDGQTK